MMKNIIWIQILCAECGYLSFGDYYRSAETIRKAKKIAKERGYTEYDYGSVCGECYEKIKKENMEEKKWEKKKKD